MNFISIILWIMSFVVVMEIKVIFKYSLFCFLSQIIDVIDR